MKTPIIKPLNGSDAETFKNALKKSKISKKAIEKASTQIKISYDKFIRNEYLEELGLSITQYGNNYIENDDKRKKQWDKEKEKYGFDSRETWNLDVTFIEWMYSHFCMFKEVCNMDLSINLITYKGTVYTFEDAIDFIIESTALYLLVYAKDGIDYNEDAEFAKEQVREAIHLLADTFSIFWW